MEPDTINIEIITKNHSNIPYKELLKIVSRYLHDHTIQPNTTISHFDGIKNAVLYEDVEHIIVGDFDVNRNVNFADMKIHWDVYSLDKFGAHVDSEQDDENGGRITLATNWALPSADLFNLWENLYYDGGIKEKLLKYAFTILEFSDRAVNCNVISCNKVILLHGPPGTGKTSLCKALAQKLAIKLRHRYSRAILVEINTHSLFSKWFSESGKLVTKMFAKIKETVEDGKLLVCLLIDEIESLAHAREQALSGHEPSDSVRVVNALLTEIDQIKRHPNVLIFTTSNMTDAIDIAFVDRADIKQFLGLPSLEAIYKIYHSCLQELIKTEILDSREVIHPVSALQLLKYKTEGLNDEYKHTRQLVELCELSRGLSGRSLRKMPLITHALFLNHKNSYGLDEFLDAMQKAVEFEKGERKHFKKMSN